MQITTLLESALGRLEEAREDAERMRRLAALDPDDPEAQRAAARSASRRQDPVETLQLAVSTGDHGLVAEKLLQVGYDFLAVLKTHGPTPTRPIEWYHDKRDDKNIRSSLRFKYFSVEAKDPRRKGGSRFLPFEINIFPPDEQTKPLTIVFKTIGPETKHYEHSVRSTEQMHHLAHEIATSHHIQFDVIDDTRSVMTTSHHATLQAAIRAVQRIVHPGALAQRHYYHIRNQHHMIGFREAERGMVAYITKGFARKGDDIYLRQQMSRSETREIERAIRLSR